jgi:hypothetical protein
MGCWAPPISIRSAASRAALFVQTLNRRDGERWSSLTPDGTGR